MKKLTLIISIVFSGMLFVASCTKESKTIDDSDPSILEGEWKPIHDYSRPSIYIKYVENNFYLFMDEGEETYDTIEIYSINKFHGSESACYSVRGYFYDDSTKMVIEYTNSDATFEKMSNNIDDISNYTFCYRNTPIEGVEFQMHVDSIIHADTIAYGEIFEIEFYALIGPNECFQFSRFVPAFAPNIMEFTLYGKELLSDSCSGDPVYLDGSSIHIEDMTVGNWKINIMQPDSSYLTSYVYVKQ